MLSQIDAKSTLQGFAESRLPHFTEEESLEIQGSADFLGFNHYTSNLGLYTISVSAFFVYIFNAAVCLLYAYNI